MKACKTEAISRSACGWGGLAFLSLVLAQPTYAPLQNGLTAGCVFSFSFFFLVAVCVCGQVHVYVEIQCTSLSLFVCGSLKLMSKSPSADFHVIILRGRVPPSNPELAHSSSLAS